MDEYAKKLKDYADAHGVEFEHLFFEESVKSVKEAGGAANAPLTDFVKSIVFYKKDKIIIAVVRGIDRVDKSKVAKLLELTKLKISSFDGTLKRTGFPAGGVPPFGFDATFIVDKNVMEMESVIAGGGSTFSLIRIKPDEILKHNDGQVADIRVDSEE